MIIYVAQWSTIIIIDNNIGIYYTSMCIKKNTQF